MCFQGKIFHQKRLAQLQRSTSSDHHSKMLKFQRTKSTIPSSIQIHDSKIHSSSQNGSCCGTDRCLIFSNYSQTYNWLSYNASCMFLQQLLGQSRQSTINQFLHSYTSIPNVSTDHKDTFLLSVMTTLSQQTDAIPATSISQGTDHSIRVMQMAFQLQHAVAPSLSNLFGCSFTTTNPSNGTCLFLIMFAALIHDTGFVDLSPGLQSFVYAPSGSILDNALLLNNSQIGMQILNNAVNTSQNISASMLEAISLLDAKDQLCLSPNSQATCLTDSTSRMRLNGYDTMYWKPYTEHSMEKDPLHTFLRFIEALDVTRERLSPKQKDKGFIQYLQYLYTDQNLRKSGNSQEELVEARLRAVNFTQMVYPEWNATQFEDLIAVSDLSSFLELYSNWIIEKVEVQWKDSNIGINVKFHSLKGGCRDTVLAAKYHSGPALYRINQLAVVAHSLYFHGTRLSDLITVKLSEALPGTNSTKFPLSAFSPRIIYDTSGNLTNLRMCGDSNSCAHYLPLFNSPEICIEYSTIPQFVNCQNIQNLGFPFSDLDYNSWLSVNCSESSDHIQTSEPVWCFPLSVAIPGVLGCGIFLMIGIHLQKKRKRRMEYETIANLDTPKRYRAIDDD